MPRPKIGHYRLRPVLEIGGRYGRLIAIEFVTRDKRNNQKWQMKCDCGAEPICYAFGVKNGRIQSCGCLQKDTAAALKTTHGMSNSPEANTWDMMIQRCTNPKATGWKNYGARGITVCARWLNSFQNFYEDMGPRPSLAHSIDRIDNDGNYEPGNCRWATRSQQNFNKRRGPVDWCFEEDAPAA